LPSDSDRPPAVWVDDLWVSFRVTREKNQTLKGTLARMRDRSKQSMLIEALRGVSFQVPTGSVYGVIGRNGAGKSTMLRTIAGILPPTAGRVAVWGRVTPLLSLGVGFNRELTGRENILLGGLTGGLTAAEVYANFDAVEEFAGLGDAIDFPMRTYSSGMFGRLAFGRGALAARDPPHRRSARRGRRRVQTEIDGENRRAVRTSRLHRADRVARPRGRTRVGGTLRVA
jgi:teichoic acid transport system ATP-binding protein